MSTAETDTDAGTADAWGCMDYFIGAFRDAPYYRPGTQWKDYEPAYRLGFSTFGRYRGRSIADIDGELELEWRNSKWSSRLRWFEAREAIRDVWTHLARRTAPEIDGRWRGLYVHLVGLLAQRVRRNASSETRIRMRLLGATGGADSTRVLKNRNARLSETSNRRRINFMAPLNHG